MKDFLDKKYAQNFVFILEKGEFMCYNNSVGYLRALLRLLPPKNNRKETNMNADGCNRSCYLKCENFNTTKRALILL